MISAVHAEDTATITCSIGELAAMADKGQAIYATPFPSGLPYSDARQLYVSTGPQGPQDFVIATVADFGEADAWDCLALWEAMTESERDEAAPGDLTIVRPCVPRTHEA